MTDITSQTELRRLLFENASEMIDRVLSTWLLIVEHCTKSLNHGR